MSNQTSQTLDEIQKRIQDLQKSLEDIYNAEGTLLVGGFVAAVVLIGVVAIVWSKV